MSNTFNFKYIMENSPSIEKEVIKDTIRESYLNTTIAALQEMNTDINRNTKELYSSISKAESKSDENKLFAEYFYQFKDIFTKFVNCISDMRDRLIINLDNLTDNNTDLIEDSQYISNYTGSFTYSGWEFKELSNPHFPKMNLREIYQKDFDYLGKVMQDKGINAAPAERIKIIASVCNEFSKCGKDGKWLKKMLDEMIDEDDDKPVSELLYKAFREKKDIEVDKGVLYSAREELMNIEEYKSQITMMCNSLIGDIQFIAEDISSYFFRNKENKLHIKTPTDGVIDRDYRLDTYSMNQVDIFMKSKTSQITKVLNIYDMALGIKIDAIVDSINQSKDILRCVKENNCCEDEVEDDTIDDDSSENDEIQMDDGPEQPDDDLNESDNDEDNTDNNNLVPEVSDDNTEQDAEPLNDEDFSIDDDSDSNNTDVQDVDDDNIDECTLFEASLFELQLMYENYQMDQNIRREILKEDGEEDTKSTNPEPDKKEDSKNANDEKSQTQQNNNSNVKTPLWLSLMRKLSELWKKFKDIVIVRSKKKIEYLKSNDANLKKEIQINNITLKYTPKLDLLEKITVPDINAVKGSLDNEETLLAKIKSTNLANISVDNESITNALQNAILGQEQTGSTLSGGQPKPLSITVKDAYTFCVDTYNKSVQDIQNSTKILEKAQDVAIAASKGKINESASIDDYFVEMDASKASTTANNKETEKETRKANKDNFDIYFKVCSNILSAKMSIYQKLFNEFYSYCKFYISQVTKTNANNSENNTTGNSNTAEKVSMD